jgi:chromosome segregation ATPase
VADPQKFNQLLDEAKAEAVTLEKRLAELERDCNSATARKAFLQQELIDLKATNEAALQAANEAVAVIQDKQQHAERRLVEAEAAAAQLRSDYEVKNSQLAVEQATLQKQSDELQQQIAERRQNLADLAKEKDTLQQKLDDLEESCAAKESEIQELSDTVTRAEETTALTIAELGSQVVSAQEGLDSLVAETLSASQRLEQVNQQVRSAETKLAAVHTKHQSFLAYEKRAKKALETYEKSLMEKERQLDVRIVTSRRRSGVLDNL